MSPIRDSKRRTFRRRRGIAAIEFVMWLPLMMFLFWMVLSAGHIFLINCEVTADVRRMAWAGRDEPWRRNFPETTEGPLPNLPGADVGKVVRRYFRDNAALPRNWEPNSGLLVSANAKQIPFMIDLFCDLSTARGKHAVLGGVWDWRELPFEDISQRGNHKPLEPSKKFVYYTQPYEELDFSPLKNLISLGAGGLSQQAGAAHAAYDKYKQKHADVLAQKRSETVIGIEQTKLEIGRLQQALDNLRSAAQPDVDAIKRVEDQLQAEQQRLAYLEEALAKLDRSRAVREEIDGAAEADKAKEG